MEMFNTTKEFPKFKILEENYETILKELPMFSLSNFERDKTCWNNNAMIQLYEDLTDNDKWIKSWSPGWYNFPLVYNSKPVGLSQFICPLTIEMLLKLDCNIAGFSCLLAKHKLPIHSDNTGPNFSSMALNQLIIGEESSIYIEKDNVFYKHQHNLSQVVIFNSEQLHFADNQSNNKSRVILYIDFKV